MHLKDCAASRVKIVRRLLAGWVRLLAIYYRRINAFWWLFCDILVLCVVWFVWLVWLVWFRWRLWFARVRLAVF